MSERSPVLLLTSCSNSKLPGGEQQYDRSRSLASYLPSRAANELLDKRSRALRQLRNSSAERDGVVLGKLPVNERLREGPDFGGVELGSYLPAVARYDGRFWKELGSAEDRLGLVEEMPHRLLVISALYGLLAADEPIQNYNLNLHDDRRIARIWQGKSGLTRLLCDFIAGAGVQLVVDLTGDPEYRQLIEWPLLPPAVRVLHAYAGRIGPGGLPALGALLQRHIRHASAEDMLRLRSGRRIEAKDELITFSDSDQRPEPPPPPPPPPDGPTMYPRELPLDTEERSPAEATVFRRLKGQLSPEHTVFHGLAWHRLDPSEGPTDGEADFIIAHPDEGILVLEVKGGGIQYDAATGEWSSRDRYGDIHRLKDPLAQARRSRACVLTALRRELGDDAHWLSVGYAVAFPDMDLRGAVMRADMDRDFMMDESDLTDLARWVHTTTAYWDRVRTIKPPPGALQQAIEVLVKLFAQNFP